MTIAETKRLDAQELADINGRSESWHLRALEAEAIHIIREVVAEFDRPGLLFSGGKDSAALLHLAVKALRPAHLPFPVIHIDTGHNFPEVIEFRDRRVRELGERLIVRTVDDAIDAIEAETTEDILRLAGVSEEEELKAELADEADVPIPMNAVIAKELEIVGSHGMPAHRYADLLRMITSGVLRPGRLVGKTVALEDAGAELEAMGRFSQTGVTVIDRF